MDIERTICLKLIEEILKIPFCSITVNDGQDDVLLNSTDTEELTSNMYETDEAVLYINRHDKQIGWFYLNYGLGTEVISDHTSNPLCNIIWDAVQPTIEELEREPH